MRFRRIYRSLLEREKEREGKRAIRYYTESEKEEFGKTERPTFKAIRQPWFYNGQQSEQT